MRLLSLAMMVVSFVSGVSVAADREQWVQWRGNARNCEVSKPVEWPSSLKPEHLKELYRVPLGPSYSGPIVSADRVFVTETVDKKKKLPRPGSGHRQGTLAGGVGGCDVGAILCGIERQLDSGDPGV